MAALLPLAPSPEAFARVHRDEAGLRPGVQAICERLGLSSEPIVRFADGSLPVYAVGEAHVLKLYPPYVLAERDREALVLEVLEGKLPIPTPELRAAEELEEWGYILMQRLPGENLALAFETIPRAQQEKLAAALGDALAELHRLRDARLQPLRVDWAEFVTAQCRSAVDRQRRRALPEPWLEQIPGWLEEVAPALEGAASLLHTEVMREHLLAERRGDGWHLSGLFDFEPAMIGHWEYELASVGLFFSCGDPVLLRRVLQSYGAPVEHSLSRRLLAWALVHRYSNVPWYMRRLPPPPGMRDLDELAAYWFGV